MRAYMPLFFVFLIFTSACNSNTQEIKKLQEQTEAVHDEAMKDMATLNRLSRSLKKSLSQLDSLPETPQKRQFMKVIAQLDKSEADMMDWMAKYRSPEGKPAAEAKMYLENELAKISKNRDDIKAAILAAQAAQETGN